MGKWKETRMPHMLATDAPDFETRFQALLAAKREDAPDVDAVVAEIIADVRDRGDAAVIELTRRFDRLELTPETLAFSPDEIAAECAKVPDETDRRACIGMQVMMTSQRNKDPELCGNREKN